MNGSDTHSQDTDDLFQEHNSPSQMAKDGSKFQEGGAPTEFSALFEIEDEASERGEVREAYDPQVGEDRQEIARAESQLPAYKNPWLKMLATGGAVTALLGALAGIYLQSTSTPTKTAEAPETKETPKAEFANPIVEGADSDLKGQLALGKQAQMRLGREKTDPTTAPAPEPENKTPTPTVTPTPTPTAAPVAARTPAAPVASQYRPRQATSSVVYRPYRPQIAPAKIDYPSVVKKPSPQPKSIAPAVKPTFRPFPGNFGTLPTAASVPPPPVAIASWADQTNNGRFEPARERGDKDAAKPVGSNPALMAAAPVDPAERDLEHWRGETRQQVRPGTAALGISLVPIQVGMGDTSQHIAIVGLNQPILDRDGKVAIPAASQIYFEVRVQPNGWVKATSTKIVTAEGREIAAKFQLVGGNGQPLVARQVSFGDDAIGRAEQRQFILGALSQVGKVLTAPNVSSSVTSGIGGVSTSSTSTSKSDVLGAVLDGGFSPIAAAQMARLNQEINALDGTARIYYLPVGTNIKVILSENLSV